MIIFTLALWHPVVVADSADLSESTWDCLVLPSAGAKDRTQCCEGQFAWEEWSCRAAGSQGCQATHHQSKQSCNALLHGGVGIFFFFFPWTQCIHYVSSEKIERAGRYLCLTRQEKPLCSSSTEALVWTGLDGGAEPGSCQCPHPTAQPSAEGGTGGLGAGVPLPCQPQRICTELEHHFC